MLEEQRNVDAGIMPGVFFAFMALILKLGQAYKFHMENQRK